MCEGETREIEDADLVADLLRAGYIEEVNPPEEIEEVKPTKEIEDADLVADVPDAGDEEEVKPKGRTRKTATGTEE